MKPLHTQGLVGALGRTRTPNLLIRSQTLYPIELRARALNYRKGPWLKPDHNLH